MLSILVEGQRPTRSPCLLAPVVLASIVSFSPLAFAQQSASPNLLPTTVVSPTGVAAPAGQTASSVTVITAADLETQQRRTVPDALSSVPGLNIVQTGGPGGLTSVFMRGTNSNHVKVLIDGSVLCEGNGRSQKEYCRND